MRIYRSPPLDIVSSRTYYFVESVLLLFLTAALPLVQNSTSSAIVNSSVWRGLAIREPKGCSFQNLTPESISYCMQVAVLLNFTVIITT